MARLRDTTKLKMYMRIDVSRLDNNEVMRSGFQHVIPTLLFYIIDVRNLNMKALASQSHYFSTCVSWLFGLAR